MNTQPVTSQMITLLQKISAQFLLLSPARQRIIIRVKGNGTMELSAINFGTMKSARRFSKENAGTVSFEALALLIPTEYYGKDYLYDLNPKKDLYGKFQFFLMGDVDHVDDTRFYTADNIPAEAEDYYNEKKIYVAAAYKEGRTTIAYTIINGRQVIQDFCLLDPNDKGTDRAEHILYAELYGIRKAEDKLRAMGIDPAPFVRLMYSRKMHYGSDKAPDMKTFMQTYKMALNMF